MRRLLRLIRKPIAPDAIEPVRPKVTPDPERAAELERRREALSYTPSNGFLADRGVAQ